MTSAGELARTKGNNHLSVLERNILLYRDIV